MPKKTNPLLVKFTGKGGWPGQADAAKEIFRVGKRYLITGGSVGQSSSSLTFDGIKGSFNSVLFECDIHEIVKQMPGIYGYLPSRRATLDASKLPAPLISLNPKQP